MLISALALHTRQLLAERRCALMVSGRAVDPVNPQTAPRLTLVGRAEPVDDSALRRFWVSRHPYAFYADFADFRLWRLTPESGHLVAGFGRAHLISARHLLVPDIAAAALEAGGPALRDALSGPYRATLHRVASLHGLSGSWDVVGVDADGLTVIQDQVMTHIPFDAPVNTVEEALGGLDSAN